MQFGDAVEVRYVDMYDPESQAAFPELLAAVKEQGLPYPLVAINGELRAAGSAHYYHVLPYVEQVLQGLGTEAESSAYED
jgi:disulfide oxidoreductase YuzD